MTDKLDMALGDIMKKSTKPKQSNGKSDGKNTQRRKSGGRNSNTGKQRAPRRGANNPLSRSRDDGYAPERRGRQSRRQAPYARDTDFGYTAPAAAAKKSVTLKGRSATVFVANLATDLSEEDVQEIFFQIGYRKDIKEVVLNYNREGKSQGTANVTFKTATAATECVEEYDGAEVDGKEMQLKIVGGIPAPKPAPREKQRNGVFGSGLTEEFHRAPRRDSYQRDSYQRGGRGNGRGSQQGGSGGGDRIDEDTWASMSYEEKQAVFEKRRNNRGGRGDRRGSQQGGRQQGGRKGGRDRNNNGKPATAEDLDAEMDSYFGKASEEKAGKSKKGGGKGKKEEPSAAALDAEMDDYFGNNKEAEVQDDTEKPVPEASEE